MERGCRCVSLPRAPRKSSVRGAAASPASAAVVAASRGARVCAGRSSVPARMRSAGASFQAAAWVRQHRWPQERASASRSVASQAGASSMLDFVRAAVLRCRRAKNSGQCCTCCVTSPTAPEAEAAIRYNSAAAPPATATGRAARARRECPAANCARTVSIAAWSMRPAPAVTSLRQGLARVGGARAAGVVFLVEKAVRHRVDELMREQARHRRVD